MTTPDLTAEQRLFLTELAIATAGNDHRVTSLDVGAAINRDALETAVVLTGLFAKRLVEELPDPDGETPMADPHTTGALRVTPAGYQAIDWR